MELTAKNGEGRKKKREKESSVEIISPFWSKATQRYDGVEKNK